MASTVKIELDVLLPQIPDTEDRCVDRLRQFAENSRGVDLVHLDRLNGKAVVCIHYNDEYTTLAEVERLMRRTGARISRRYQHQTLAVRGMHCTDCATSIERVVGRLHGVLDISVNYAAESMRIEFDSQAVKLADILKQIRALGYRVEQEECETWLRTHGLLVASLLSGLFLLAGYAGDVLLHWPPWLSLSFYVLAYLAGGFDAARQGMRAALNGQFDIDFLMVLAAAGAAIIGEWAEGALLLFLFSLGHALEHAAMDKARNAIRSLAKLSPKQARIRRDGVEFEVPIEQLQKGDLVIVREGERFPIDGRVKSGVSDVDESPITGESMPVTKQTGAKVFAGTINGEGTLEVIVTRLAHDTTLARVIKMVEEAQTKKSKSQRFAQRVTRVFVPIILVSTVSVIFVPPALGWLSWTEAFLRAMTMLVGASPCALAISTPSAILAGIAQAARCGVLIKGGVHLENLGGVRAIAFDKTGTLTIGRPKVTDLMTVGGKTEDEVLGMAAAAENHSQHPLAQAIVACAAEHHVDYSSPKQAKALLGQGIEAIVDEKVIRIGNERLFAGDSLPPSLVQASRRLESEGKTCVFVKQGAQFTGLIALADTPRPEAKATIERLKRLGLAELVILTGDNARVGEAIAGRLGIATVVANLLPEQKVEFIRALLQRHRAVAMVGDGINDAPAMATATIGIAMGGAGTDVALETADIALMSDALNKLPFAIGLSRQTRRVILQNIIIALGVIAMLVPTALLGMTSIGIAIMFHEGSTILVVLNALRLLRYRLRL